MQLSSEPELFAARHRGGVLLERYGVDLYPHPYLGFTLPASHRSEALNTDVDGFRHSDSPFGMVDSASWTAAGGGGLVLGNSATVGLGATCDRATVASQLAFLTGSRQLNLGLCAGISLQEVIAAVPFLPAASTVVIIGGAPDFANVLATRDPDAAFGPVSYERTFVQLARVPIFDLAVLAAGKAIPDLKLRRRLRKKPVVSDLSDAMPRVEAAVRRRLRDLEFLVRAAGDQTRILFCVQPYANPLSREFTPEEQERYNYHLPHFGRMHSITEKLWGPYADLLGQGCAGLGVPFLNMSAGQFAGSAFMDNVHLTDDGYRQAAQMIHRALQDAPAVRSTLRQRRAAPLG
jgi:lysophospholipase L1-like esterase